MTIGRAIRESPLQIVGNGLDRSVNLPTCWGRLPHSVREMSQSDRGRPPPSAGGTRKARDGGASHIKIYGRAWKPAPTTGRRVVAPYARITVCPFRTSQQIPRREQAPALPCKMHFVRRPQNRCNLLRVVETPTPTHETECVCPTSPNSFKNGRRKTRV